MSATDINLDYADDGRTLQNATLAGNAAIELAAEAAAAAGQKLAGELHGHRPRARRQRPQRSRPATRSRSTLPATKDTAARTIRSNVADRRRQSAGPREMKFSEGVEYREAATKTQGARIAKARTLEADLDPAAGTLQQAQFTGNFDFTDGADARAQQRRDLQRHRRHAGAQRQGDHARDQRRVADAAGRCDRRHARIRAR